MMNRDLNISRLQPLNKYRKSLAEARRPKRKSLKNVKFFVSSRLPCYDIEEPWGLFYYGETLFPMPVTLIMINCPSLGWDGAGQTGQRKGLSIALSSPPSPHCQPLHIKTVVAHCVEFYIPSVPLQSGVEEVGRSCVQGVRQASCLSGGER